jgi:hypothetical protein
VKDSDVFQVDWDESWRERPLNEEEWDTMKADLAARRETAESLARERGAWNFRLVLGLVTHTVFHLGVIRVKFDVLDNAQ